MKLVFATHNAGKVAELRALCAGLPGLSITTLRDLGVLDDVVEDGATLADNARIKARASWQRTGLLALADDSGLEVEALGGAPGVHSARYAGEPRSDARNLEALLRALEGMPEGRRQARFCCCLCLCGPGVPETLFSGQVSGTLLRAPRGSSGFGYDPIFVPDRAELEAAGLPGELFGRTLAEMEISQKNRLSHRARALALMMPALRDLARGE